MNNDGEPFVCGDCFRPFGAHAFDCPRLPDRPLTPVDDAPADQAQNDAMKRGQT